MPAYPPRREQRGVVVQWPGTVESAATERKGARPLRRRRRVAPLRGWASTLVVAGILGMLLTALAAARIIADQAPPAEPSPTESMDTQNVTAAAISPPAVESAPIAPMPASVARTPARPIRFASKPIEPSYTVQAGDSLFGIALRYNTTADAIQAINNLPDRSVLSVGQRLVMP